MPRKRRRHRLQICAENQLARRPDLLRELEEAGCVIEREECLDQCTRCNHCAFALVSGRYRFARSAEEFVCGLTMQDWAVPSGKR